jgi:hypothetical protein
MSDEKLRKLERQVAAGDLEAVGKLAHENCRREEHDGIWRFEMKGRRPVGLIRECRHCGVELQPITNWMGAPFVQHQRRPFEIARHRTLSYQSPLLYDPKLSRVTLSRGLIPAISPLEDHAADAMAYMLASMKAATAKKPK